MKMQDAELKLARKVYFCDLLVYRKCTKLASPRLKLANHLHL